MIFAVYHATSHDSHAHRRAGTPSGMSRDVTSVMCQRVSSALRGLVWSAMHGGEGGIDINLHDIP